MRRVDIVVETEVSDSPRCRQLEGMFDVPRREVQKLEWHHKLPIDEEPWNVGLIVGPSGCGKTLLARKLWGDTVDWAPSWGAPAVIDDFPADKPIEEVAAVCQAVGFNTIPAWLRPHGVLSNGEQFRVGLARRLLEQADPIVVDEFTSVVDRQVAQIGSHAVQKYIRRNDRKFVAVTCHFDVIDWLQPDWIFSPAEGSFVRRSLQQRPAIDVEIGRLPYSAWRLFAPYHYLTASLHRAARCFGLWVNGHLTTFSGVLHRPQSSGNKTRPIKGCSRLVTLPDWQGLGLAFVLSDALGALYRAAGYRYRCYPAHPALVRGYDRSPMWAMKKRPGQFTTSLRIARRDNYGEFNYGGRPCAVFEYAGPAHKDSALARQILDGPTCEG